MQTIPVIVITHTYSSQDAREILQQGLVGMTSVSLQQCIRRWHFKQFCPIIQETEHCVAISSTSSRMSSHPLSLPVHRSSFMAVKKT